MVDRINRLNSVRRTSTKKKEASAGAASKRSADTASSSQTESSQPPSQQALQKQMIMSLLIEQFGEKIVQEPRFHDLYKFFEKKVSTSQELSQYIDSKIEKKTKK